LTRQQPDNHGIPRKEKSSTDSNNVIVQKLGSKSRKWQSYHGVNLEGKKGRIVQVLRNSKGEEQGYRVRFPEMKIQTGFWNSHRKTVKNFEFSFYKDEVKRTTEHLEVVEPERRGTRSMVERDKAAARRLRSREGLEIGELVERFNVSRRTIYRWLE